jgi:AmmeMemoRadiSam system protein B
LFIRKPAVAGEFYPADSQKLSNLIDECYLHRIGPGKLPPATPSESDYVAVVSPHAGYEYSGPVAANSYFQVSSLLAPELLVIVAPNHHGIGSGVSTFKDGEWETPLGRLRVDSEASKELAGLTEIVSFDPDSHRIEHSLEVQLPFLQRIYGNSVPMLPISLLFQDIETSKSVAKGLAKLLAARKAVIVASSDLTHYESADSARSKDIPLLREVQKMDLEGFYSTLERLNVTACGFGAIATVMETARVLGSSRAELLKYATSGDTTGDNLQVVGYGALRFV